MTDKWERVFLLWPRKVDGSWRWLSYVERREYAWGCALYGDYDWEYRSC